jgi:hypothetical protein
MRRAPRVMAPIIGGEEDRRRPGRGLLGHPNAFTSFAGPLLYKVAEIAA